MSIGLSAPPPMAWEYGTPVIRRSTSRRVAILAGLAVGFVAVLVAAYLALTAGVQPGDYATVAEYNLAVDAAMDDATPLVCGLGAVLQLVLFAVLAPKVGYRRRDAFFAFVPVWSYVFACRVLWRATALPDVYWPTRAEG